MEQFAKCKSLVAIFRDDKIMLDGPHEVSFDIEKDKVFHIDVEQCGIRKISLTSDVDVSVFDLYALFSRIERLLMLFDGAFISLSEIQLPKSDTVDEKILHSCEEHFMKGRLSYFMSADFCNYSIEKMLGFDSIITADLFCKWENLLDELGQHRTNRHKKAVVGRYVKYSFCFDQLYAIAIPIRPASPACQPDIGLLAQTSHSVSRSVFVSLGNVFFENETVL